MSDELSSDTGHARTPRAGPRGPLDHDLLSSPRSTDTIDASLHERGDRRRIDVVRLVHEFEDDIGVVDLQSKLAAELDVIALNPLPFEHQQRARSARSPDGGHCRGT